MAKDTVERRNMPFPRDKFMKIIKVYDARCVWQVELISEQRHGNNTHSWHWMCFVQITKNNKGNCHLQRQFFFCWSDSFSLRQPSKNELHPFWIQENVNKNENENVRPYFGVLEAPCLSTKYTYGNVTIFPILEIWKGIFYVFMLDVASDSALNITFRWPVLCRKHRTEWKTVYSTRNGIKLLSEMCYITKRNVTVDALSSIRFQVLSSSFPFPFFFQFYFIFCFCCLFNAKHRMVSHV